MQSANVSNFQYNESANRLAQNRSNAGFPSYKPEHATIILTNIIGLSKDIVRIYSDTLPEADDAEFHNVTKRFLDNKKVMQIVLRDNPGPAVSSYLAKQSGTHGRLDVRIAGNAFKQAIRDAFGLLKMDMNFATGDDKAYRMESTEVIRGNKDAFNCFNDAEQAGKLVKVFDKHFAACPRWQF